MNAVREGQKTSFDVEDIDPLYQGSTLEMVIIMDVGASEEALAISLLY